MTPEKSHDIGNDLVFRVAKIAAPHRPVPWFLDVDGVLNAFQRDAQRWDDPWYYERFNQTVDGIRYRITYAPDVMRVINLLVKEHYVDIHWLTTWQSEANGRLMSKLRLAGPFPVLPNPAKRDAYGRAEKTPDTEDGYRGWWKLNRVQELLQSDPTMRAIWTDDDLPYESGAQAYLQSVPDRLLPLGPLPQFGLTPDDMHSLLDFIAAQDQ